jgi:hypothetical protein
VYIAKGDRKTINELKKLGIGKLTEFIEPNYIYKSSEVPNDPDYSKHSMTPDTAPMLLVRSPNPPIMVMVLLGLLTKQA